MPAETLRAGIIHQEAWRMIVTGSVMSAVLACDVVKNAVELNQIPLRCGLFVVRDNVVSQLLLYRTSLDTNVGCYLLP